MVMLATKINPNCYAHNGKPYWSTEVPPCICGVSVRPYPDSNRCRDSGVELPVKDECTCMCHIDVTKSLGNSESTLELKQQISELRNSLGNTNGMILQQRDQIDVIEKRLADVERLKSLTKHLDGAKQDQQQSIIKLALDIDHIGERLIALERPDGNIHRECFSEQMKRIQALEASNAAVDDGLAENAQAIQRVQDGLVSWCNDAEARIFKNADNQIDNLRGDIAVIRGDLRDEMKIIDRNTRKDIENICRNELNLEERIIKLESSSASIDSKSEMTSKEGMTFVQALEAMKQDKSVRRAAWANKAFYQSKYKLQTYQEDFKWEDFEATDWEIFC